MLLGVGYSQDCDPDWYNCDCNIDTWETYYNSEGHNMEGCYLYDEDLAFLNLNGANLTGANFEEAHLYQANLTGANLTAANLQYANIDQTNLQYANLEGAYLWETIGC